MHPKCTDNDSHKAHKIIVDGKPVTCDGYIVPQPKKPQK